MIGLKKTMNNEGLSSFYHQYFHLNFKMDEIKMDYKGLSLI
jgi:hypothetical protein